MLADKKSDRPAVVIAVILMAVMIIGEVVVYTSDYTDYSATASLVDESIYYEISSDGTKSYSVIINDNGDYTGTNCLYIYRDETYPTDYNDVDVSIGAQVLDQKYYIEQVLNLLKTRNYCDVIVVNSEQLAEALADGVASGTSKNTGLLMTSGTFPDTVYRGNENDLILQWVSDGGSLYWVGNLVGATYASQDGLHPVEGYQYLFFGSECLNTGETDIAYSEIGDNGYTHALSLQNNKVKYAVNPDLLPDDRASLSIGFIESGYASITIVQHGSGMICVFGGDYSNYQIYDLVQIIASGLGPHSTLVSIRSGTVSNGIESGRIEGVNGRNLSAFIYLGGYYPVYGKLVWL